MLAIMSNRPEATIRPDESSTAGTPARRCALFDYGFRPFFLLCGAYAMIMVPWWMYRFAHASVSFGGLPAIYWHAHEMLYGFVMAAIAGFLLTAVPSWTGERGFAGAPLMVAAALWIVGRVAMSAAGAMPFWLFAAAELALVPFLLALLAPPILRTRNRNVPILAVLVVLWTIDCVFVLSVARTDLLLAAGTIRAALDFVLILVTIIGGRIVPIFTANALRRRGETATTVTRKPVEYAVIGLMVAIAVADVFAPQTWLSGMLAAAAALAHVLRLAGWRSFRTRGEPILWIMHVACWRR
jgi:uncharacterized protein involved in response to NO